MLDLHCHILPGVDDGAKDLDMAVEMAETLAGLGFSQIAPSPHYGSGPGGDVSSERAEEERGILADAMRGADIDIELLPNAEHHLTGTILERVEQGSAVPIGGTAGGWLLTELPWTEGPDLHEAVFRLQVQGFKVLLAHPERIEYLSLDDIDRLAARGVAMQLELGSIPGQFGRVVAKRAKKILDRGWVQVMASDMHRPSQGPWVHKGLELLRKRGIKETLMEQNPRRIAAGDEFEALVEI